jgi:NAD-dependent deacetylase
MVDAGPLLKKFVEEGTIPTCEVCGSAMKPNVVLFGEMLPVGVMYEAEEESKHCDLMLVGGSSLEVAPASDLPFVAKENGAAIIVVNLSSTIADAHADVVIHEDVATALPRIAKLVRANLRRALPITGD